MVGRREALMVSNDEVDKPIRAVAGWLSMHSERRS
jgi:hypothetical protein